MITITIGNLIGALALAFTIGLSVAYWLWDPASPRKRKKLVNKEHEYGKNFFLG